MRFLFLVLFSLMVAQDRSAVVTGFCYLEDETDYSGIEVTFDAVSGSAVTQSVFTEADGSYIAALVEGIYLVSLSKDGFIPFTLPLGEINFFEDTELESVTLLSGIIMEVSGTLDGNTTWTNDFQYWVTDNLTLNSGDTLMIEPGVDVLFMGHYEFGINGVLYALGTEQDSVRFTSGQPQKNMGDWKWLDFRYGTSGSHLAYAVVEYGGSSTFAENTGSVLCSYCIDITIQNSSISYSLNNGIYINQNEHANLIDNDIHNNGFNGIFLSVYAVADISSNDIHDNGKGIMLYWYSSADISNNDIYNNSNGLKADYQCLLNISNNHFHYNSWGIQLDRNSIADIISNDIYNNGSGMSLDDNSSANISNNDIHDNTYNGFVSSTFSLSYFDNNVIYNNGTYGIKTGYNCSVDIYNTLFWGNFYSISIDADGNVGYNCFWNNVPIGGLPSSFGEIITVNANGDSSDTWSNIFMDPMLTDIEGGDYTPLEDSPLIDAGSPDYLDPDGSISDIGAIYFDQGTTPPVINSISADNTSGIFPLPVQFYSDFSGPVNSFEWDFGDGVSSSGSNPVHLYTLAGSYSVSLTVQGPGGTDTYTLDNMITINEPQTPPIANFSADVSLGLIPLEVQFSNQSQNLIDSYLWDFGDGNSSTDEAPSHTYTIAGDYTVTLTVDGPYGSDTIVQENLIIALEPEAVVAGFNLSAIEGVAPVDIEFSNESIGTIDSYLWDFGDGNTSTESNPVHTYTEHGEYTITLLAEGPVNSDVTTSELTILSPAPIITSITDVPEDQGGRVYVSFVSSGWDTDEPNRFESYQVERLDDIGWVGLATYNAYGQSFYTIEATTLNDSTALSMAENSFRIIATMDEGIWISNTGTGYSVDNIVPEAPVILSGEINNNEVQLTWLESSANDLDYYQVFRDGDMVAMTDVGFFNDYGLPYMSGFEYSVKAVDTNGNESDFSEAISIVNTTQISLSLNEGANLISFYALPDNKSVQSVLFDIQDNVTGIIGEGVAATQVSPGEWVGSLSTIQPGSGYWIKMEQADNLDFVGTYIGQNLEYVLLDGLNLISFPHPVSTPIGLALPDNVEEYITHIIGESVAATQNSPFNWVGSLSSLQGGKGYWVKLSQPVTFNFNEPAVLMENSSKNIRLYNRE